jgi:hypothetical protein
VFPNLVLYGDVGVVGDAKDSMCIVLGNVAYFKMLDPLDKANIMRVCVANTDGLVFFCFWWSV